MSDASSITRVTATKTDYVYNPITIRNYASEHGLDADMLLDLNRHLGFKSINDTILRVNLVVPVSSINVGPIIMMDASAIEPYMKKIRPYVREVLYNIRNFEITTRELVNGVYDEYEILLPTHTAIYAHDYGEAERLFIKETDSGYKEYKKRIFRAYYDALKQLGIFHRNMVYLYHLSENYCYCQFTQTDATKLRHALMYAHKVLIPCLSRIGEVLNFLSLNYRALTGSYGDYTLLQNMTDVCNGFFPLLNENFRSTGEITEKLNYTFFDYSVTEVSHAISKGMYTPLGIYSLDDFVTYTSTRLETMFSNGIGKVRDSDLFDYGKNYSSLKENSEINSFRDDLDQNYKDNIKKVYDEYADRSREATTQYYSYHIPEVREFYTGLESDLNEFIRQHRKFNRNFKPGKLDEFKRNAHQAIREAEATRSYSSYSSDAADKIDMMDATIEIFNLSVSIFCTAAIVNDEISGLQKLWMSEEELLEQAELFFDKLSEASRNPVSQEAREALTYIYQSYQQFQDLYEDLLRSDRIFDTIVKVVVLVIAIAIIVVVTVCTGGAGATLAGGLGTLGASLTTTQVVIVVATEALAFSIAFEALSALIERRDISNVNVMSGFVTNLLFYGAFNFIGNFFKIPPSAAGLSRFIGTARELQLLQLKRALMISAKIATMTLATIVCSAPGFIYRIGMTYNRLPDAEEWVSFLAINALIGGAFSTLAVSIEHILPSLISRYRATQLRSQLAELQTNLDDAGRLYNELNRKYGTTIDLEQSVFDDMMRQNRELSDKIRAINDAVMDLRRELQKLQVEMARIHTMPDLNDFNELLVVDQTLDEIDALIARSVYRQPPRRGLAVEIDRNIFGVGNANCLSQMSFSKDLYIGRIPAILDRQSDIEMLLSNYSVEIGLKRYDGMDAYCEGTLSMVLTDIETREIVDAITVLDEFGNGTLHTHAPVVPLPNGGRPYEWFGTNPGIQLATAVSEYIKIAESSFDEIMRMVDIHTRDMNHPLVNLSEPMRIELRNLLRGMGIKPKWVARVQSNSGAQYPFGKGSITYVFDLLELLSINSRKELMIKIGYNSDALEGNLNDMLYIFEITNQSLLMEPSVESLHKAFMDMVKRSQATEAQLRSAGLGQHAIESIEKFKDPYRYLLNQFQRGRTTPLSEGEISTRVHNLIEEVNSSPFTDTYPPEANYVLTDLSQPVKSGGRIKTYSDYLKRNNIDIDTDLKYIILNILNKHFSTYPQYTNNGYTLSVLGNKGVGEYHMIVEYDQITKTLKIGYIEMKSGSVHYTVEKLLGE